ncbi:MAG: DUF4392 domain-containing protein, partial [Sporomusaceae bacterium]|nr:DUF4392 domain-containing protein [Sporomusaceae bacterium]
DRLMTLDISARGIIGKLYEAAREKAGEPLTLAAAKFLQTHVKPKDFVMIATGFIDQPVAAPGFAESDGPAGAVALAKAVRTVLNGLPIILVDECSVEQVKQVAQAAGFHCLAPEQLVHSVERQKLMTVAVLPFPLGEEAGKVKATELLDTYKPAACIAIERGGMNEQGKGHNMIGFDTGSTMAFLDLLFAQAYDRSIPTMGIGDGGNEIGMGNIKAAVQQHVPYGTQCQCGCGGGIAAATPVSLLVTAAISNWGAYAICDMLSVLADAPKGLCQPEQEQRVIEAGAAVGLHDAIYGSVAPSVDGCYVDVHHAIVRMMQEVVAQAQMRY